MNVANEPSLPRERLTLELRRGAVVLAVLAQLRSTQYGYSLQQRMAESGFEVEQGTLYPLLRRLDEQGLLESAWDVEGSRPRKYYHLSASGAVVLRELGEQWRALVGVMAALLEEGPQGERDGAH